MLGKRRMGFVKRVHNAALSGPCASEEIYMVFVSWTGEQYIV